jgi:hypothetical protein
VDNPLCETKQPTVDPNKQEEEFKKVLVDCEENKADIYAGAVEYCHLCSDLSDGLGDLGYQACLYDACELNSVDGAESKKQDCIDRREEGTENCNDEMMVIHLFEQFDADGNDFISTDELVEMLKCDEGSAISEDEAKDLMKISGANKKDIKKTGITLEDMQNLFSDDVDTTKVMGQLRRLSEENIYSCLSDAGTIPPIEEDVFIKCDFNVAYPIDGYEKVANGRCTSSQGTLGTMYNKKYTELQCLQTAESSPSVVGFSVSENPDKGCYIHFSEMPQGKIKALKKFKWISGSPVEGVDTIDGADGVAPWICYKKTPIVSCATGFGKKGSMQCDENKNKWVDS